MNNPSAKQWLAQAKSDLACAERCLIPGDAATYCHAIAKYQQAVEKAIKALVVALNLMEPTRDHEVTEELKELGQFSLNPRGKANKAYAKEVKRLFDRGGNRPRIRELVQLSPKYPAAGAMARRNTEYPFQNVAGEWKIPADAEIFSTEELNQFRQITGLVIKSAGEIAVARQLKITA